MSEIQRVNASLRTLKEGDSSENHGSSWSWGGGVREGSKGEGQIGAEHVEHV